MVTLEEYVQQAGVEQHRGHHHRVGAGRRSELEIEQHARRAGDGGQRVGEAEAGRDGQADQPLRLDRPADTRRLEQEQRQQQRVGGEFKPAGMDRGQQPAAGRDARQQAGEDRRDAFPHARHGGPIDDQHVDVDEYLDQHQRRIEHSIREEQQPHRHGERREAVAQRAVDEGGEERDADQGQYARGEVHGRDAKGGRYSNKDQCVNLLFQMKLIQLRYLSEVARRNLNISEAAEALHTSQPGVSKQIKALEEELGIQVFARHGKPLGAGTKPGKPVVAIPERILTQAQNLRRAGEEYANDKAGTLTIAATHTQARYALPKAVAAFKRRYPNVELLIHQGNPTQICDQVIAGEADMAVATEMIATYPELISLPVYQWNRCVVVPPRHPLLKAGPLTLEKLAEYPIVTYDFAFANRSLVQKAFENRGLSPHVVLSAQDSDVIKTYVELGLGIGILARMAFDEKRDRPLRALDASHLFESSTTRLGVKPGAWLRRYVYEFIELFAPHLPRAVVERAVTGEEGSRYEL